MVTPSVQPTDPVTTDIGSTGRYTVTVVCEDRPGIVHAVSGAVVALDGTIEELQQFTSADTGRFCMRLEISAATDRRGVERGFSAIAQTFEMDVRIDEAGRPRRTLVLASTATHCVADLLAQTRAGRLPLDIRRVVANHATAAPLSAFYGAPFEHHPIVSAADKDSFERRVLELVAEEDIELVVLARYMQILSPSLCEALSGRCINIHHSFLPGFKGANPYRQAYQRGVKQIGATAHFVTTDLDEGPIIEQNVTRVDHTRSPEELRAIGQDEEVRTLRQAVSWFAQSRVLLDGRRTIVFR